MCSGVNVRCRWRCTIACVCWYISGSCSSSFTAQKHFQCVKMCISISCMKRGLVWLRWCDLPGCGVPSDKHDDSLLLTFSAVNVGTIIEFTWQTEDTVQCNTELNLFIVRYEGTRGELSQPDLDESIRGTLLFKNRKTPRMPCREQACSLGA